MRGWNCWFFIGSFQQVELHYIQGLFSYKLKPARQIFSLIQPSTSFTKGVAWIFSIIAQNQMHQKTHLVLELSFSSSSDLNRESLNKKSLSFWKVKNSLKVCDGVRSRKSRIAISVIDRKLHPARCFQRIVVRKLQQRKFADSLTNFHYNTKWTQKGIHCGIRWM